MPYVIKDRRSGNYHAISMAQTAELARAFVFFTYPNADRNRYPHQEVYRVELDNEGRPTNPQPVTGRN